MVSVFSTDQPWLYAELSDIERKTTILLQTQITSEELSVEAKVCCKQQEGGGRTPLWMVGLRLSRVLVLGGGHGKEGLLLVFLMGLSQHQCIKHQHQHRYSCSNTPMHAYGNGREHLTEIEQRSGHRVLVLPGMLRTGMSLHMSVCVWVDMHGRPESLSDLVSALKASL